jgi:hypothetical protein
MDDMNIPAIKIANWNLEKDWIVMPAIIQELGG